VDESPTPRRSALFGPLPTRGIWTALGLTRAQFVVILAASVLLFVFVDGPLWRHLHDRHFARITVSYAFIPPAVGVALYRNGHARLLPIVVGAVVIGVIKLVLTAALLVVIAMARG
jgi:hypothetical protein